MDDVANALPAPCNTAAGGNYNAMCLVLISTGNPAAIRSFSQELTAKLSVLVGLLSQLRGLQDLLMQTSWHSTYSAPAAAADLTRAFDTFKRAIDAIEAFIKALQAAADALDTAMAGANQAVLGNDTIIGQLLADPAPASQTAARTRAAILTGNTNGFLQSQRGALTGTAGNVSGNVMSSLGGILSSIGQLMGGSSSTPPRT